MLPKKGESMKVFMKAETISGIKTLLVNLIQQEGNFLLVERDGEYWVAGYSRFFGEYWLVEESVVSVFPLFWAEEVAESLCL